MKWNSELFSAVILFVNEALARGGGGGWTEIHTVSKHERQDVLQYGLISVPLCTSPSSGRLSVVDIINKKAAN